MGALVKPVTIAVAGNPNCGKTTLFNSLTGGKQRIGNWPGVTVEKIEGTLNYNKIKYNLVDLPGIYSLSAFSEDEKVARDYILSGKPDLVINIVDSTNLERNLYLTAQLIEMKVPVLLILNMIDLAKKKNIKIDITHLEKHLEYPVIAISALEKKDIDRTKKAIQSAVETKRISKVRIEYPNEVEDIIKEWIPELKETANKIGIDERWIALRVIEGDPWVIAKVNAHGIIDENEIKAACNRVEKILGEPIDVILADYKYGLIHGICRDVIKRPEEKHTTTDIIDKVVMNRILGIPFFLIVMYLVFWVTISIGGAFIDFFDIFFGTIFVDGFKELLRLLHTPLWIVTILADGLGTGIQTVATFIPIIFSMFFMLSILEDSGYMARGAFVMDNFMRLIGLPGKAFVSLLVGFGCTVPAIMGTRTLDSKKDRFMTIFMTPFMSCGARLPVYALFGAAFFGRASGGIIFSLYFIGILFAVLTGFLLKNTLFKGEISHFIMELPPYHMPRFKHIMLHTWIRLKVFILRAGQVIVIAVIVLSFFNSFGTDGTFGNEDNEKSVLSTIGKGVTPVFEPMGIEKNNWPATVGIFTGLFAKEAIVGTLNSLYGQIVAAKAENDEGKVEKYDFFEGIAEALSTIPENLAGVFGMVSDPGGAGSRTEEKENTGIFPLLRSNFTKTGAYAYLLFILLYFPCIAAFGAAVKELGKKYSIIFAAYFIFLSWSVAVLFFQIAEGHNVFWIIIAVLVLGGIYGIFDLIGRRERNIENNYKQ